MLHQRSGRIRGWRQRRYRVSLQQALSYPVKAQPGTIDGTVQQGIDFYGIFEQLEFAAGKTQKAVRINVVEDDIVEPDEHFYARIAFTDGANIDTPLTKITIVDSAAYPRRSIRIDDASAKESDGRMNFRISLSGPYHEAISVYAATGAVVNGAEPGKDFHGRSQRITFAAGETVKRFSVTVIDDSLIGAPERFNARIFKSTGNADISDKDVAIGVIDGSAPPQVFFFRNQQSIRARGSTVFFYDGLSKLTRRQTIEGIARYQGNFCEAWS